MPVTCSSGCGNRAILKRPKTSDALCKECFFWAFEEEVHHTIVTSQLFQPGESVAIAASGGKDSTVLAYLMKLLNTRHNYGLKLVLLSIDEGITGYRDDSLETVKRNEQQYCIPLTVLSYEQLYGWTMDRIVQQVGRRNNCTFCGVFRRQALDRGAALLGVDKMVTGHNADDIAETVIMNVLRGDVARLSRCCAVETGSEGSMPRSKPFKYTYEKEIVMYAYFKKLDYFSTECIYSPNAYRGHARAYIKELERIRPSAIIDIIHSGECLSVKDGVRMPTQSVCTRCGFVSSQAVCKACVLLEGLNKGRPRLGIGKSSKVTARMKTNPDDLTGGQPDIVESIVNSEDLVEDEPRGEDPEARTCSEDLVEDEPRVEDSEARTCSEDLTVEELRGELGALSHVEAEALEHFMTGKHEVKLTNGEAHCIDSALPTLNNAVELNGETVTHIDTTDSLITEAQSTREQNCSTKKSPKRIFSSRKKLSDTIVSAASTDDSQQSSNAPAKCSSLPMSIEDIGNIPGAKVCENGGVCSGDCLKKGKKARKVVRMKDNPEAALKTAGISKEDLEF